MTPTNGRPPLASRWGPAAIAREAGRRLGRLSAGLLLPGTALVLLTSCSSFAWSYSSARSTQTAGRVVSTNSSSAVSVGGVSMVSCSGDFCSVTLGGAGSTGEVFGTAIVLEDIHDGTATVRIGGRSAALRAGQSVSAGVVRLRCTSVTPATVTFTGTRS